MALPMLTKCRRVHECKVAIVALLSLMAMDPQTLPPTLTAGYPHLLNALLTQLKLLPKLVAQRSELHKVLDESLEGQDDDLENEGALDEFDDDADVQEDDSTYQRYSRPSDDYLEILNQEAARLRSRVASIDGDDAAAGDDDDVDDFLDDFDVSARSLVQHLATTFPFFFSPSFLRLLGDILTTYTGR